MQSVRTANQHHAQHNAPQARINKCIGAPLRHVLKCALTRARLRRERNVCVASSHCGLCELTQLWVRVGDHTATHAWDLKQLDVIA